MRRRTFVSSLAALSSAALLLPGQALARRMRLTGAAAASSGARRPFTLDDLLDMEQLGAVRFSEDGRWLVVSRRRAWMKSTTYRLTYAMDERLGEIDIFDARDGQLTFQLTDPTGAQGFTPGPISPDGMRMVVYRLTSARWSLGVVHLETGTLRWFDPTPEQARLGRTLVWRSNDELIFIARPEDDLPFTIGHTSAAQDRIAALWRLQADGRLPSAVYLPSGRFRDSREQTPPSRLLQLNLSTGRSKTLHEDEIWDISLSPDGQRLAALSDAEDIQIGLDQSAQIGAASRRRRLHLIDLAKERIEEPLPDRDFASHLLAWSGGSRRLLTFARPLGGADFQGGDFWILGEGAPQALDLGERRPDLQAGEGGMPVPRGAWDGEAAVVRVRGSAGPVWLRKDPQGAVRLEPAGAGDERLALIAGALHYWDGRGLRPWGRRSSPAPSAGATRYVEAPLADGGDRESWNPDAADLARRLTAVVGAAEGEDPVAASSSGSHVGRQSLSYGGETLRLHAPGSPPATLVSINTRLAPVAWGAVQPVDHRDSQSAGRLSWVLLPPVEPRNPPGREHASAEAEPAPIVVLLYPGREHRHPPRDLRPGSMRIHVNAHLLAAAGYAVLIPSLPLNDTPDRLDDIGERVWAIVQAAADQHGLDPNRTAIVGHSYGANAAALAATQSRNFRAVVAWNGFMDLAASAAPPPPWRATARYGSPINRLWGWTETGQGGVGATFPEAPLRFARLSALHHAAAVRTPLLLIESDFDGARMAPLFAALYRANAEAALLAYFGEGHANVSPANIRDIHERILSWLDVHVRDRPGAPGLPVTSPGLQGGVYVPSA